MIPRRRSFEKAAFKPSFALSVITAVHWDPSGTKQCTSNNKGALKYKDDRTQLPACSSDSAVITWARIIDPVLSPSCVWCGEGSDVLRQQDVFEDPVWGRGTGGSTCTEDGCDRCTNYRKCIMCLSSGNKSQSTFDAMPNLLTKLKEFVSDKRSSISFYLNCANKFTAVQRQRHI